MPNHITNRLTLSGDQKQIDKMVETFSTLVTQENGDEWTRFPDFRKLIAPPNDDAYNDLPSQEVAKKSPNWWYEWNCNNWGTKWNAYACEKISENVFEFDTAWSTVHPIFEAMKAAFPKVCITVQYADEDTGANCGTIIYDLPNFPLSNIPKSYSKEAYELAFKLSPQSRKYYKLVGDNYEYFDEEE